MWNLRAFADCGVLRFHKVAYAGAALEMCSGPQTRKWAHRNVVVQAALRRDAVRFDQNVVAQDHVAQHAAGPNRAALADFRLAKSCTPGSSTVSSPAVTSGSIKTVSGSWMLTPLFISSSRFHSRKMRSTSARSARVLQPSASRGSGATCASTVSFLAAITATASVRYSSRWLVLGFTWASAGQSFSRVKQ